MWNGFTSLWGMNLSENFCTKRLVPNSTQFLQGFMSRAHTTTALKPAPREKFLGAFLSEIIPPAIYKFSLLWQKLRHFNSNQIHLDGNLEYFRTG